MQFRQCPKYHGFRSALLWIHPYKIMPWRSNQSSAFIHDGAMPWDVILRDRNHPFTTFSSFEKKKLLWSPWMSIVFPQFQRNFHTAQKGALLLKLVPGGENHTKCIWVRWKGWEAWRVISHGRYMQRRPYIRTQYMRHIAVFYDLYSPLALGFEAQYIPHSTHCHALPTYMYTYSM